MDTAQVKELIQRWRSLNADLKTKNKELEEARESLRIYDGEHSKSKQEWDFEKEKLRNTINAVLADVTRKKSELKAIEEETAELRRKVEERRRRNEEHLKVLTKRKNTVLEQLKEVEKRDAGIKSRLSEFQANRAASKEQLLATIKKVEESLPQERETHEQKISQLKSKIAETEATIEAEAKSWALEQALRAWNEASRAHKWLLEEVAATESGKDTWANLIQEANALNPNENLATLRELSALLSAG
ncbi:unnamed protein product [Phytomonas sp. EM1]|nr:unnamed protein product [Phytomonas sp. EM1]|eukprot:CCW61939.1 unnamed protein product [Phytomonas sp. isolate EM1]